jgi:RNA polymerase sigma-70 factor, ECF subfamily
LILRYFEELPIAEIAEILGENVNTLKTRLYRTLRILRAEMEENHGR